MVVPDLETTFAGKSILCLVGPTASGKTGLITQLAQVVPLEVISLDSRQIYHGLRVGTAQPTVAELATCPHHLVDFVPIDQTYDAAQYREDFCRAFLDIQDRGKVAVIAGGAGFYLKAISEGFMSLPADSQARLPDLRAKINAYSVKELRTRLEELDPAALARIHPHDLYRLRRALEICLLSGCSMTQLMAAQSPQPCLGLDFKTVLLEPSVAKLDQQIQVRTKTMLEQGWIEETRAALNEYGQDAPGLQSIGYPQVIQFLQGELGHDEMLALIIQKTRQYAKRQRTWFRKISPFLTGNPQSPQFVETLKTEILQA